MSVPAPPERTTAPDPDAGPSRWRRWLDNSWARNAFGLLVLAAIVGGLVAIDRLGGEPVGALDDRRPEIGKQAPDFALRDADGTLRKLSDYRGHVVWVNFWATWCIPCRRELPDIQRVQEAFKDQGLVVLEVNQEESAGNAADFFDELGVDLPILLDSGGAVSDQYRLFGLPANFFIDQGGVLRSFRLGFLTESQMRDRLGQLGLDAD